MKMQRFWRWLDRHQGGSPRRRFKKAWWGGWPSRIALIVSVTAFIALPKATSLENAWRVVLPIAGFYSLLALMGWLNNYAELEASALRVSQMGIVTPGGPTYAGGRVSYSDMVDVTFIPPRSVHIRYNAKDWRRRPTIRTEKLFLEHADEFVAELSAAVEGATGSPIAVMPRT